jgi:hypothetical protein
VVSAVLLSRWPTINLQQTFKGLVGQSTVKGVMLEQRLN